MLRTRGSRANHGVSLPLNQPLDKFSGDAGREKATRTILVDYTSWRSSLPSLGDSHPDASWITFKGYDLQQQKNAYNRALLVLEYEQEEFDQGGGQPLPELPEDVVTEDAGVIEIDIVRHPDFDASQGGWGGLSMADCYNPREQRIFMGPEIPEEFVDEDGKTKTHPKGGETVPLEIRGMSKYVVGTGTVTIDEYFYNKPGHVIPDSGKRSVPSGYPGGPANWLVMSGTRRKDGAFWIRSLVYQYSEKPISGVVYEDL